MENKRPPIGIMPEKIWKGYRLDELILAFERFINVHREIPKEWIEEYNI